MDVSVKIEKMDVELSGGEEPLPTAPEPRPAGAGIRRQPPPPLQLHQPGADEPGPERPLAAHGGPPLAAAAVKRHKPIPPPLDLRMPASPLLCPPRTAIPVISPSSPYHQKNLPFRKRAFSWSNLKLEDGVPSTVDHELPEEPPLSAPPPPGAGPLLSPRPLIRVDATSRSVPCTPHLALLTPSALLSPAPSHVSSSAGSSQEEIRTGDRFLFPPAGVPPASPHAWHSSVWHTFMAGTKISFHLSEPYWMPVEELVRLDGSAAPYGLLLRAVHTDVVGVEPDRCVLHLQAVYTGQPEFLAACAVQQPFFVQNVGWSSLCPEQTFEQYSVPCRELRQGDVCLTSGGPLQSPRPPLSVAHTPPGSPAARVVPPPPPPGPAGGGRPGAPPPSPAAASAAAAAADKPVKPKRPMNGFMLFAKKYRVELINQHPGKDNRAISVMLGETWKGLPPEERERFTQQARILAEEKKRMYPDCWKRKRSVSAS
ncbi:HMG box-containing protein 1-like [Amphibalanus amphitrite]|uniref:HMG box-containing protein 1-like n=1 Tax=Amphibalanus amphitrite TaxID=1232801 RepID=UPI001C929DCD|nr:HMG box-containing protein 1-like [Amphibalanus amphitrite]